MHPRIDPMIANTHPSHPNMYDQPYVPLLKSDVKMANAITIHRITTTRKIEGRNRLILSVNKTAIAINVAAIDARTASMENALTARSLELVVL